MSRDLLRSSNNEALEHELDIQRRLIDRMRDNQKVFYEQYKRATDINENLKDEINKIILSFRSTLDDFVNKLETDEPLRNAGIIIYRYNLLANGLKKLGYVTLPINLKQEFTDDLNDMIPKIEELIRYADVNNFTDIQQLKEILNSFVTGTFKPIGISAVKYTQGIYTAGRDRYNELSKDILESYNLIINNIDETNLTDKQISEIQKEIEAIKKIGMKVKTNKDISEDIIDRLAKSKELLDKYVDLIMQTEPGQVQRKPEVVEQPAQAVGQLFEPAPEPEQYGFDIFAEDPEAEARRLLEQQTRAEARLVEQQARAEQQGAQTGAQAETPAELRKRLFYEGRAEAEYRLGQKIYFTYPEWKEITPTNYTRYYYNKYRDDLIIKGVDRKYFT